MKKFNLQESSRESRGALHLCVLRCTSVRCAAHVLCVPGPATLVRAPPCGTWAAAACRPAWPLVRLDSFGDGSLICNPRDVYLVAESEYI